MKIKTIEIKNFRGIANMLYSPEHVNVFVGKNGSGKTSILNAIHFALTGEMKGEYIKNGAKSTKVEITFEDDTFISRKRVKSGTISCEVNGKKTTAKSLNEFVEQKLGTSIETYKAMVGIDYLTELNEKDLSKFFLNILPVQIKFSAMMNFVNDICKEQYQRDVSAEEKAYLEQLFHDMIVKDAMYGLDTIKEVYNHVYEERRGINAVMKSLAAKSVFDENTLPKESKEELKNALYSLVSEEALVKEFDKKMLHYNQCVQARKDAELKIKELTEQVKAFESIEQPNEEKYQQVMLNRKSVEDNLRRSQEAIGTFQANVQLFMKQFDNLNNNTCPLSEKLVCQTDKTVIKNELLHAIQDNKEKVNQHEAYILKCKNYIAQCDAYLQSYQKQVVDWTNKLALEKQIHDFVLPIIPEQPEAVKKEKDFVSEKNLLNQKLDIITKYEEAKKNQVEYEEKAKELKLMEFVLLVLDVKKGVPATILNVTLQKLASMCNAQADKVKPGMSLEFHCENGFEVLVETTKGEGYLPISTISNGEKLIVSYLLLGVVNQITNAKYLVLDNMDKLDAEHTKAFVELLKKDTAYEHIFIGAVNHSDTVKLMDGVSITSL